MVQITIILLKKKIISISAENINLNSIIVFKIKEDKMIINSKKRIVKISAKVSKNDLELMEIYILGAVHGFTAAAGSKNFKVRDLFGYDNRDWNGTPIQEIYEFYLKSLPYEEAAEKAAQDVGKLLRKVLTDDKYEYEEVFGTRECTYRRL